jgi:FKBP-type peptidyl-prolyl cis-trans isomerase
MSITKQINTTACLLFLCIAAALPMINGCKNGAGNLKKTASGLEYKIIDDEPGNAGKVGDYLKIHITTVVHDSSIFDTHKPGFGSMWKQLVKPNGQPYDLMEGFALLSKGDSAEFVIPADSVMRNPFQRPPFIKKGDMIHIYVKVLDIKDEQAYQSSLAQQKKDQLAKDEQIIQAYLDSTHLKGTSTESGVYVVTHKEGSGPLPQDGQEVTVMYTGKTLDGKVFDSNEDTAFHHTQPLIFTLGNHMMIPGMEDGVKMLKKGSEATLIIPSGEAYGPQGREPVIKPNAVLMFDVKVKNIAGKSSSGAGQK